MSASNQQAIDEAAKERDLLEIFHNLENNTMRLDQDSTVVLLDVDNTLAYLKDPNAKYNDFLIQRLRDLAEDPKVKFCLCTKMSLGEIQDEGKNHARRTELLLYLKKFNISIERILMPGDLGHKHPASTQVLQEKIKAFEQAIVENTEKITQVVIGENLPVASAKELPERRQEEQEKIAAIENELAELSRKETHLIALKQKVEAIKQRIERNKAEAESAKSFEGFSQAELSELRQAIQEIEAIILEKAELPAALSLEQLAAADIEAEDPAVPSQVQPVETNIAESTLQAGSENTPQYELVDIDIDALLSAESLEPEWAQLQEKAALTVNRTGVELEKLKTSQLELIECRKAAEFRKQVLHITMQMKEFAAYGDGWDLPQKRDFFKKIQNDLDSIYSGLRAYPNGHNLYQELVMYGIMQLLPRYDVLQKKRTFNFLATGFYCTGGSAFVDYYIPAYRNRNEHASFKQYRAEHDAVDNCNKAVSDQIMPRQETIREQAHTKAPYVDALFSDFEDLTFPGKIIFFDDGLACITSVGKRIAQYNVNRREKGLYPIEYIGVHLHHDGKDSEINRAAITAAIGQHLQAKALLWKKEPVLTAEERSQRLRKIENDLRNQLRLIPSPFRTQLIKNLIELASYGEPTALFHLAKAAMNEELGLVFDPVSAYYLALLAESLTTDGSDKKDIRLFIEGLLKENPGVDTEKFSADDESPKINGWVPQQLYAYEQGRKVISAASAKDTHKHNKQYKVFLFDKDDILVTRSHDGLDDGVPVNPEIHELMFTYMAMHSDQMAWGVVSTGGGAMGDLADGEITHDPDLFKFREQVLHDGFKFKDYSTRHRRVEHFYAGFYRRRPEFILVEAIEVPENVTHLSKSDFAQVIQYGETTVDEKTGAINLSYINERVNLQYQVMPGDTITLKSKNGLQIIVDLYAYIHHRDLHRKGDNKVFQALDGMSLAKVTVIPNEAMRAMGIVDILAPEDFIFISPEQIFGLDDKQECVAAWQAAGFKGAVADSRMVFASQKADAERLMKIAEERQTEAKKLKAEAEQHQIERETSKEEIQRQLVQDSPSDEDKLLILEEDVLKLDGEILKLRTEILRQRRTILEQAKEIQKQAERAKHFDELAQGETDTYIEPLLAHLGVSSLAELEKSTAAKKRAAERNQRARIEIVNTIGANLLYDLEKKCSELDPAHPLENALKSFISEIKIYMENVSDISMGRTIQPLMLFSMRRSDLLQLIAGNDLSGWWSKIKASMIEFDGKLKAHQDVDEKRKAIIDRNLAKIIDALKIIEQDANISMKEKEGLEKLRVHISQYLAQVPPGACLLTHLISQEHGDLIDELNEKFHEAMTLAKACDQELAEYDAAQSSDKNEAKMEKVKPLNQEEEISHTFQSRLFSSVIPATPQGRALAYIDPVEGLPQKLTDMHNMMYENVKSGTLQTRANGVVRDITSISGATLWGKKVTSTADKILTAVEKLLKCKWDHTQPEQRANLIQQLKDLWDVADKGAKNGGTFAIFSDNTSDRKRVYETVRTEAERILRALDYLYPDAGAKISSSTSAIVSSSSRVSRKSSSK